MIIYLVCAFAIYLAAFNGWLPQNWISKHTAEFRYAINSRIVTSTDTWNDWLTWWQSWIKVRQENQQLKQALERAYQNELEKNRLQLTNRNLSRLLQQQDFPDANIRINQQVRVIGYGNRIYPFSVVVWFEGDEQLPLDAVVIEQIRLAGRVIASGPGWARVLHITDSSSRVPVEVLRSGDRGIVVGNNNQLPSLEYYPDDYQFSNGDVVTTSGHGGLFPAGIVVGEVLIDEQGNTFVIPAVQFQQMGWLQTITSELTENFANIQELSSDE